MATVLFFHSKLSVECRGREIIDHGVALARGARIEAGDLGTSDSSSQNECSRPPNTSICHLAPTASISASNASRSFLGTTGVFRAVHHANGGLDIAGLRRERCQEITVQTDDRLHVGTGARELQAIAASAKTEADRSLGIEIADLSFRALAAQRVERGSDAQPSFGRIGTQGRPWLPVGGGVSLPPPYMSATRATYLLPAMAAARLMASSLTPIQFGAMSKSGRDPLARSS